MIEYLTIENVLIVIGAASTIIKGLELIVGVTPSKKDDEVVGKARKAVDVVLNVIDKLALNPKK